MHAIVLLDSTYSCTEKLKVASSPYHMLLIELSRISKWTAETRSD